MRRGWLTACLFALPVAAQDATETEPAPPADAEFLEFLAETAGEDEDFVQYVETRRFERELQRIERERAAAKEDDHEKP